MTQQEVAAIVTGGAQGIGKAIAEHLAGLGHPVALVDLDEGALTAASAEITAVGGRAVGIVADITDPDQVERAVERVVADIGQPAVLVNNAGITRDDLLFKMSVESWDAVMAVHLRGAFLMTRAVQRHMIERGWGRIVNLSSAAAQGNRGQANYSSAKAGLQGFTKTVAIELGRFGITANAVAPGFIETAMTQQTATRMGLGFEEFKERAAAVIPVARVGRPEDVAAAVAFFVSQAAGFVSGQVLYVAGGPCD